MQVQSSRLVGRGVWRLTFAFSAFRAMAVERTTRSTTEHPFDRRSTRRWEAAAELEYEAARSHPLRIAVADERTILQELHEQKPIGKMCIFELDCYCCNTTSHITCCFDSRAQRENLPRRRSFVLTPQPHHALLRSTRFPLRCMCCAGLHAASSRFSPSAGTAAGSRCARSRTRLLAGRSADESARGERVQERRDGRTGHHVHVAHPRRSRLHLGSFSSSHRRSQSSAFLPASLLILERHRSSASFHSSWRRRSFSSASPCSVCSRCGLFPAALPRAMLPPALLCQPNRPAADCTPSKDKCACHAPEANS
jgi:hypothetical protein